MAIWAPRKAWNTLFLENHDQPRSVNATEIGKPVEVAKMLATYIFSQGNPLFIRGRKSA